MALGIFPPYTASLEVLHAISRCDVIFNNVAGPEVRDLLAEFWRSLLAVDAVVKG